jgi:photosystem II stability/assembly factor-like uncharacterized protein
MRKKNPGHNSINVGPVLGSLGLALAALILLLVITMPASADPDISFSDITRRRGFAAVAGPVQVAPMTVTLSVTGSTVSGTVVVTAAVPGHITATRAVLQLDGTPRGLSTAAPFTWDWVTTLVANGEHSLAVEAYNALSETIASGGVTLTVDNRVTPKGWMQAGLSEQLVHDVEASPGVPGVVYAVVDNAVYKTTDWGGFWGALGQGLPTQSTFHCLSVDPSGPRSVFLGTASGVYVSGDGGETWQPSSFTQYTRGVAVGGADGQSVYAISGGNAVYRSSNAGSTWIPVLGDAGLLHTLSVDPIDGLIAYVGSGDPWTEAILHRTEDGGETWDSVVIADPGEVSSVSQINHTDRQTMYLGISWGPGGVFKSIDDGVSWQQVLDSGVSSLARAPAEVQTVYVEAQWGDHLFVTDDGGQQWEDIREGLPAGTPMHRLAVDSANPGLVYAAAADHGLWSTVYAAGNPVPLVTGVWPNAAYNDRVATVTLTGTGFTPTPDVMLDSTPLPKVTFVSSTTITATVPVGLPAGCYRVVVFNPSGQVGYLDDCFTLLTPTEIEIVEPKDSETVSGTITIRADVGEGNGIQKVDLYLDDMLHTSSVISPHTWIWNSTLMDNGLHEIKAVSHDMVGGTATSDVVIVDVNNLGEKEVEWSRWAFEGEEVTELEAGPKPGLLWSLTTDALYRSIDYGATWSEADVGLPSGVQFVAVSGNPTPNAPVYAAKWDEVFVTRDAGLTWVKDNDFASNIAYLDFVDDTPYAATYGYQLLRRLATGEWEAIGGELEGEVYDVATYQSTLYAGTSGGLYRLTENAWESIIVTSYALVYEDLAAWLPPVFEVKAQPQVKAPASEFAVYSIFVHDGTMFLGTSTPRGIYRSEDGETWIACDVGLTQPYHPYVRDLAASSTGRLFAATADGVFVSENQGGRWQALDTGLPHTLTGYGVLLDSMTATSLSLVRDEGDQQKLGAVFNDESAWSITVTDDSLLHDPPPQTPPKAVLVVGPVDPPEHAGTQSFIDWADRLADVMERYGMNVVKVYWPDSTWENVRAAIGGASIVVYKGHGFGLGDIPADPTEMYGSLNGFCLVDPTDPPGARLGTQDMLVATNRLAENAIGFFFCCYCGGGSASDPAPVSEALARRRIEAYASTVLRMGGGGYFSGTSEESILEDLFAHLDKSLGDIYRSAGGDPEHVYPHILWPEQSVWFDGDTQHGWGRAFVGDPNLTGMDVLYGHSGFLDMTITKTVKPQDLVRYGDEITYALVISATPGAQVGLYDPLMGTVFLRFVDQPAGVSHMDGVITGLLTITPTQQITVSFVTQVDTPDELGRTDIITNRACVYPLGRKLDDCVWSNEATIFTSHTSGISIEKSVTPQDQVNYGDEITYTLVISAAPGVQVGLYDPLEDATWVRFVECPPGVFHIDALHGTLHLGGTVTGTLEVTPTNRVTVSFVARVGVPDTLGWTVDVSNRACVYPLGNSLDDCVWSNEVENSAFRPYGIYLPTIVRDS